MKTEIEPIETSATICAFKAGGYQVILHKCDADPSHERGGHLGFNIISQSREIVPVFAEMNGMDVLLLKSPPNSQSGPKEVGGMILAQNLTVALEYIANRNNEEVTK